MASESRMQTLEACPPRQVPGWLDPCREPLTGGWELLACGAPHDAGHAVPIWHPDERESQQGEAPLRAGVTTAASSQMGLLRRHLEVALLQPGGPHPKKPCRVLLPAEGPHPVIRLAAQPCLTPTGWLHPWLTPAVQGRVHRHLGEDGRDRAPVRRPSLGMDDLTLRVYNPCLQPCAEQVEQGPGVETQAPHVQPPRRVHVVQDALDSSLSQGALPSVLAVQGAVADRLQRPPSGALAVPTLQKVLRIDCGQELRTGQWHPLVFQGGHASGPFRAVGLRHGTASDHCGPVALRVQPLHPCRDGALQVGGLGACGHVVHPTGRLCVQGLPAGEPQRGIPASGQIPTPVSLVRFGFVGSPPQGGWLLVLRSDRVRQQLPVRAPSCRHVLPPVVGCPHP